VPGAIQSIERAAALLQLVAEHPGELGLGELADGVGLAKATTHGLLRTLRDVGFLTQDSGSGRYSIGTGLRQLADSRLDPHDLRSYAMNWADSLAVRSGEAVRIAAVVDRVPTIVHHVFRPDDSHQVLDTGLPIPGHATALGKVLLAWTVALPVRPGPLDRFTQHTITSSRVLARELVEVRRQGWAAEVEEQTVNEAAVAAPIRGAINRVVGAISLGGAVDQVCDSRGAPRPHLIEQLLDAAHSLSRDLVTARR